MVFPFWWLSHSQCSSPTPAPPPFPAVQWLGINGGHSQDYTDSLGRTWHHARDKWTSIGWGGYLGKRPEPYTNNWNSPRFQCSNWPPEYEQDYEPLLHHYSTHHEAQTWRVNLQSADAPVRYYTVKWVFCEKNWWGGAKMDFRINGRLVKQDYTTKHHHTHTDIYNWQCVPAVDGMIELQIVGTAAAPAGGETRLQARFSTLEFNRSVDGCDDCSGIDCNTGMCVASEFYDQSGPVGQEGQANLYQSEQPSLVQGMCYCGDGISGDSCEVGACAQVDCNEPFGGICNGGTCTCINGHSGPDCSVRPNTDGFGCYSESKDATERLTVSRVCLPERVAGPTELTTVFRGPSPMHLVADKQQPDVAYFSWTADRQWGKTASMGDEGRIYVSKLSFPRGQMPTLLHSTAFDGFVRAGGIDVTDTGIVGTLCAKHWPPWMEDFVQNHHIRFAPMALAVCEVVTSTMAQAGTPWRIGKQHLSSNNQLPSTGIWGAYTFAAWFEHRSAGYGWLAYSPKSRSWSAWYGASVGEHTGYAMHTYQADAPQVSASTFDQYVHPVPADKMESRVENITGPFSDNARQGTGDHQAGGVWRYHPLLGDIGLQKHTHGGVYMQQYGLEQPSGAFSPPGHSTGRVSVAHGGDEAIQEGSLRPCGDGWITGLVTQQGNVCARVSSTGAISAWRVIDPSVGELPFDTNGFSFGVPGGMVRLAPLGSPEGQALCGPGARFLFGYETLDRRRWLVELDSDCNEITAKQDVTAHTHWPVNQEWATTAQGDVVWITSWVTDDEGRFGPEGSPNSVAAYPAQPYNESEKDDGGYLVGLTPSGINEAWLTVYHSTGPT